MRISAILVLLLSCTDLQARASAGTVTYYLDGAKVEYEAKANRGYLEVQLPAMTVANSLRIKPLDGCSINRVEITPVKPAKKTAKQLAGLLERKNILQDKLSALDTREQIFKAAAKSQSGRAVRKTKTNPEPMANIRQGTEFALAQLESAYAVRSRTERELAALESRIMSLQKENGSSSSLGKVWLTGNAGRVQIAYLLNGPKWLPMYNFSLDGAGSMHAELHADYPVTDRTTAVFVVPHLLADGTAGFVAPLAVSERFGKVAEYQIPLETEEYLRSPVPSLAFAFKAPANAEMPAGVVACFRQGEYLGTVNFTGSRSNELKSLTCGK
jgi:hypothetical protein